MHQQCPLPLEDLEHIRRKEKNDSYNKTNQNLVMWKFIYNTEEGAGDLTCLAVTYLLWKVPDKTVVFCI